jgi:hypothetical protein
MERTTWVIAIATIVNVAVAALPIIIKAFSNNDETKSQPQQSQIQKQQIKSDTSGKRDKADTSLKNLSDSLAHRKTK